MDPHRSWTPWIVTPKSADQVRPRRVPMGKGVFDQHPVFQQLDDAPVGQPGHRQLRDPVQRRSKVERRIEHAPGFGQEASPVDFVSDAMGLAVHV